MERARLEKNSVLSLALDREWEMKLCKDKVKRKTQSIEIFSEPNISLEEEMAAGKD